MGETKRRRDREREIQMRMQGRWQGPTRRGRQILHKRWVTVQRHTQKASTKQERPEEEGRQRDTEMTEGCELGQKLPP